MSAIRAVKTTARFLVRIALKFIRLAAQALLMGIKLIVAAPTIAIPGIALTAGLLLL